MTVFLHAVSLIKKFKNSIYFYGSRKIFYIVPFLINNLRDAYSYLKISKDYKKWIKLNETFDKNKINDEIDKFKFKPKLSIVIPVYNIQPKWLRLCIKSIMNQFYDNWELCLYDDGSTNLETLEYLKILKNKKNNKIKISFGQSNKHICYASNEAIKMATGDYVAFLDNDDKLTKDALFEIVKLLNKNPSLDLIYSDEDKIDENEERSNPFFKPDFSLDLLLSVNYICHFLVIRKDLGDKVKWFRQGFEGAQDFDLILRCLDHNPKIAHISKILYHWRMLETSTSRSIKTKDYAHLSGINALKDYLERSGIKGEVKRGYKETNYRVKYRINKKYLVSIIIPFKDKVCLLRNLIKSILEKSTYENYEILIINNNSRKKQTYQFLDKIKLNSRVEILNYNHAFNYSKLNNFAAKKARGKYLIFLNNDTLIISPDWIEELLRNAQRREVGAVGPMLLFKDGSIQHAGVILGIRGFAGHIFRKQYSFNTYYKLAEFQRNYLALTAACLMISKDKFFEVDGFNEDFHICGGDVDLCLSLHEKHYLNVYNPKVKLFHFESKTREKMPPKNDVLISKKRYKYYLEKGDPFYNKNLSTKKEIPNIKFK
ncbi:MAG: glycosyltransferase [Candidatus Moranbacteria bacterium]|nr:glycosyltransferase [Candidatus Moranbacteria bacterium]